MPYKWRFVLGPICPPGDIDREALGELVFGNPAARRRLNTATHLPVLLALLRELLRCWLQCSPVMVVDMPLLFETGFSRVTCPRVLVACSPEVQVRRCLAVSPAGDIQPLVYTSVRVAALCAASLQPATFDPARYPCLLLPTAATPNLRSERGSWHATSWRRPPPM